MDLPRSVLLYNPDTFGRCNFSRRRLTTDEKIIIYDFHKSDRFFVSERAGRRATQHRTPYPINAPELLPDVQSLLKRVHRAAHEAGALTVICSYIGEFQGHRKLVDTSGILLYSQLANAKSIWR